jgi:hypothetical protein
MSGTKQRPRMTFEAPSDPPRPTRGGDIPPPPAAGEGGAQAEGRQRSRIGKRAITFYVSQEAFKQVGILSVQTDRTVQDLMQEALDHLFQQHGLHRLARD